jgi:hypothetical protein
MTGALEIFLGDLTPEAQRKVLRFLKLKGPKEANLDTFPLFTLPKPESKKG